jgi:medium-chain acyl-[acyl-carrier-protein] hydrolase
MTIKNIWTEDIVIPNFECDFQQRWKPSSFFQAMTEIASKHAAHLGFSNQDMLTAGKIMVLSRMRVRFDELPVIGQSVIARTWLTDISQKIFFVREFELYNASGVRIAAASSAWLLVDTQTRRFIKPQELNVPLPLQSGLHALDESLEKINPPQDMPVRLSEFAGYSEIDLMGHVNNARYVEWIMDCFPLESMRTHKLHWMQVNYTSEVQPGEHVAIAADASAQDPDLWRVAGTHADGTRAFEAELRWG